MLYSSLEIRVHWLAAVPSALRFLYEAGMRRSSRVTCLKWSRVRSSKGGYVVFRPKARQTYLLTFSRSVGLALDRFAGSIPVVPSAEKGAGLESSFSTSWLPRTQQY